MSETCQCSIVYDATQVCLSMLAMSMGLTLRQTTNFFGISNATALPKFMPTTCA